MHRRQILLLVASALLCLGIAAGLWRRAFPLANLEFRVTRSEAQVQLARFVEGLGHPLAGYRAVPSFGEDTETKNYLELEQGIPRLEALSRDGLNVWYWEVRWFKPEQHEEFTAALDPLGRMVGFDHTIDEERALPSLDRAAARALAEDFLKLHAAHHPLERLHFNSDSSMQRPHRLDWNFEWEREDLRVGDARYLIRCEVQGNELGEYSEGLDVPEAWTRSFAEKRSVNDLCETIAQWAALPIAIGAVIFFIVSARHRELRWRDVAPRTWLLVFALSALASDINEIPTLIAQYSTLDRWDTFLSKIVFSSFRGMLFTAAGMWFLLLVADPLYRELLPRHASFRRALGPQALDDPRTLRALGVGIVLATVGLAYVTTFYVVTQHFGAWSPVEIDYTKTLSGWLPWAEAMQTGFSAAFGEELVFRVIGVALYVKLMRNRPLALVIAGASWAFLHSNYPQMPGYLRGVELTIAGVFWGAMMLRFGIVSTLTAHYLYDCWLGCFAVWQSAAWYDKAGALAVSLWPVAFFGYGLWRRARGHVTELIEEVAEPRAQPLPAGGPAVNWDLAPRRLAVRWRWILGVAGVTVTAFVVWLPLPNPLRGLGKIELPRKAIVAKAEEVMRAHGQAPERFRRLVSLSSETLPATYLLEHGSLKDVAQLYGTEFPDLRWHVRYFRVKEREEFSMELDKAGRLLSWNHAVPQEAPGAQLERDAALALAQAALTHTHGVDLAREKLVAESTDQEANRRDHSFTFEREGWQRGEAKLRTTIQVRGDEPVGFYRWIKTPEAWALARAKSGWRKLVVEELGTWIGDAEMVVVGVLFVLLLTRHLVPWRLGFLLALVPTVAALIRQANAAPAFFAGYQTTTPLASFLLTAWGQTAVGAALEYLKEVLQVSVALGLVGWAFGWRLRDFTFWPAGRAERRTFWANTAALLAASLALYFIKINVVGWATISWFSDRVAFVSYPAVTSAQPWLDSLVLAFNGAWDGTFRDAVICAILALLWSRWPRLTFAVLVFEPLLDAAKATDWPSFAFAVATGELDLLCAAFLIVFLWRANVVLIFLYFFLTLLIGMASSYLEKGGPDYRWEAAPLFSVLALVVVAGWLAHRRPDRVAVASDAVSLP